MSKIFEFNGNRQGTLIDSISKTAGTLTAGVGGFRRTSKGVALLCDNSDTSIDFGTDIVGTGDITFEAYFNAKGAGKNGNGRIFDNGTFKVIGRNAVLTSSDGNTLISSGALIYNTWYHLIITRTSAGICNIFINNQLSGSVNQNSGTPVAGTTNMFIGRVYGGTNTLNGNIALVRIYNHLLSSQECDTLYREFLQAQVTEKPVRGFELVKPTDLSYQKDRGLLLAYNMKPNGSTLVDISGNAINGTLDSGCVVEKNQLFIPVTKVVTFSTITVPVSQNTICWRGKVKAIPGTYARLFATYGMFTSNMASFLLRSANDPIVTFSTGLTTSAFNQDFDLVIARTGDVFKLYINGVLANTKTVTTTIALRISGLGDTATTTSGEINYEDFRVYNRELSLQEIKDYHNSFIKPIILEDWSGSAVSDVI